MKHFAENVINQGGTPVSGASVSVFLTGTQNLATIYSDDGITPKANPVTTDTLGRFDFYVADGRYDLAVAGPTLIPFTLSNIEIADLTEAQTADAIWNTEAIRFANQGVVPGTPPANNVNIYTKSLDKRLYYKDDTGTEIGPLVPGGAGVHLANNIVQYVSPFGNDANDGLTWGTTKRTIYAALTALPGGQATFPPTAGKGTVYVADGGGTCTGLASDGVTQNSVQAGLVNGFSANGTGIWIMGPTDPNYANPPTGWLHFSGPFAIIGVAGSCNASQSRQALMVDVAAGAVGGFQNATQPAIWISGVSGSLRFENLSLVAAWNTIRLSIDSNGSRTTGTGAQGITFKNITGGTGSFNASAGPTVDMGANVFWIWFEGCTFSGNIAAPVASDNRANMVLNRGGGSAPGGLITVRDNVWNGGGGFKFYTSGNGNSLMVDNLSIEGASGHGQPAIWLPSTGVNAASNTILGNFIFLADYTDMVPAVRVDGAFAPTAVVISNSQGNGPVVTGPATVLGLGGVQATVTQVPSPALSAQTGFFSASPLGPARIYGQQDTLRRSFAPVTARFAQKALQLPSAWTSGQGVSTLTAVGAPDGTTNAGRLVGVSNCIPQCSANFSNASITTNPGDWVIAGVWARSNTANGFAGSPAVLSVSSVTSSQVFGTVATTAVNLQPFILGDGDWQWYYTAFKVLTVSGGTGTLQFQALADTTHTVDFYAPILLYIPTGTISDNEASEIAQHLVSYPETAGAGEVSMLRNQYLRLGSTAFANLGTPANGVFIYCSDCTVASPCASGGTGALAKRLAGSWICN